MDSDPISEGSPVKRRKTGASQSKVSWNSDNDSGDELFEDFEGDTVPTQIISRPVYQQKQQQHPSLQQSQTKKSTGIFSDTLNSILSQTQPTQPLNNSHINVRSSPDVEVVASSPPRGSPVRPTQLAARVTPLSSLMAPPGTSFRRPGFAPARQISASQASVDKSVFEDPPVVISDDEDEDVLQSNIKPTKFVKGGRNGGAGASESSSDRLGISRFAYNPNADDMASAYGGGVRRNKPQTGPSRTRPVEQDLSLADITDPNERDKIMRMKAVAPNRSIRVLRDALQKRHGNFDDAMDYVFTGEGPEDSNVVDLDASSDVEITSARPIIKPRSTAKQDIKATKTIQEKYRSQKTEFRKIAPTQAPSSPVTEVKSEPKRKRLVQRKRAATPESDHDEGIALSSGESEAEQTYETEETDSDKRLLKFFNTCSVPDLADLANTDETTAQLIIAQRPFSSLDAIREISSDVPNKSGKKTTRKAIGDKIVDVCSDMWEGYEAVDTLVERCEELGKPIWDSMKKWGIDLNASKKSGELEALTMEDSHDSGIATPASSTSGEDAIRSPVKKKAAYLSQPASMSKDLVMKDYQVFGLNWLNLLWSKRLSCILADDMGLGKTCQVISFIAHLKEIGVEGTHLVIVPGSTLENWLREFNRFCPDINVTPYYGGQAEREAARIQIEEDIADIDVIVTTYDIAAGAKGDNKFLRKYVKPHVVVFDEGHMLKNATSKRHMELMRIPAKFRLLLTGTPLQNNLQELASLLGFILPELFDESREALNRIFSHKAKTTDDGSHAALLSSQRITRARSMIAPFILRRKKAQVLSTLPAKHRRVQYCDMVPAQQRMWHRLITQARAEHDAAEATPSRRRKGAAAKAVHMSALRFCALHPLLLREIYDDEKLKKLQKILLTNPASEYRENRPDLVWKYLTSDLKGGDYGIHKFCLDREDYIPESMQLQHDEWMTMSGKMPVLKSLLQTWIPEGSRVLIFSQFTTMLDILEAFLATLDIRFVRLDGSTRMTDRQERIDAFDADDSIKVFMLSTKAGGAGINLASANKVVILEGGFNPQDEIQAENRAHRVGQTRQVEVVRLVTRNSIEELILNLGESKLALDERVGSGIGNGQVAAAEEEEKEGEKTVEAMFFKSLAEGGMDVATPPMSVGGREEAQSSDGEGEEVESPPKRGAKRKRVDQREEQEVKKMPKRTKKNEGGDIAAMFRKGMRNRGVNVED